LFLLCRSHPANLGGSRTTGEAFTWHGTCGALGWLLTAVFIVAIGLFFGPGLAA